MTEEPTTAGSAPSGPIAVCGMGGMGLGMAMRLRDLGHPVAAYNRTASRAAPAVAAGAVPAATPADAARSASIVIISVSDADAVDAIVRGSDGVLATLQPGAIVIDLSTTSSRFARELAADLGRSGVDVLDGCVVGNPMHARSGELRVLVGGADSVVERAQPVLRLLGKEVVHVGETGSASTMKLALNLLMGAQMTSLAEAVTLAEAAGIAPATCLDIIASSGYASPMMAFRCALIAKRAFQPALFRTVLMAKDLDLAVDEAARWALRLPVTEASLAIHRQAIDRGYGEFDAAVLVAMAEHDAGLATLPDLPAGTSTQGRGVVS